MKIHQLLSGVNLPVTNEEQEFIERHKNSVKLSYLDERDLWLAQNLVRKGMYSVAEDHITLRKN